MLPLSFIKKIPKSKRVTILLPQFASGEEVEVLMFVRPLSTKNQSQPFDMVAWAEENAEDWGDKIRSTDVESFTGRRF